MKLSIKMKVTLWYTMINLLIVLLTLAFLIIGSSNLLKAEYKGNLIAAVDDALEEIEYDDGELEIDNDIEDHSSSINIMVYDLSGNLVYGDVPKGIETLQTFSEKNLREEVVNNQQWYIYDLQRTFKKHDALWVRGAISIDSSIKAAHTMLRIAAFLLPFLVGITAFGGYLVTKRAFKPIQDLNDTVSNISNDKDLSKRVPYSGQHDEIYQLTANFNGMFKRLQLAFEKEKQFTSDASHELRTPIAVISAQCEYGLMQNDKPEEMQQALETILKQSKNMSLLVNQLLTLARADSNKQKINIEKVNLSELVELTVESLCEEAEERQIKLLTEMPDEVYFYGDQTLIMRLFINLISNGIAYGKIGGFVKIKIVSEKDKIVCMISDNGIGIKKENLPKIWDRFYQVDAARSKGKNGSSGLGLAMVQWIVSAHHGKIEVESQLGKGTEFKVELPK